MTSNMTMMLINIPCPLEESSEIALAIIPPAMARSGIVAVITSDNFHPTRKYAYVYILIYII
jgi:hypothetical protein